jgi:Zn-dependent peptidase ImmA (M78 family)
MTLAHELGHAVMHSGEPNYRHAGAQGKTALSEETPYVSAEHQAKVFASAFLIHDEDAAGMTVEEISIEFGVSLEAAQICFDRLQRKAERARSAERVLKMAEQVKAALSRNVQPYRRAYLEDICTVCHRQTLVANGLKVFCETCGFNGDRFQDGDKAA